MSHIKKSASSVFQGDNPCCLPQREQITRTLYLTLTHRIAALLYLENFEGNLLHTSVKSFYVTSPCKQWYEQVKSMLVSIQLSLLDKKSTKAACFDLN
jgi:hypothetical protein